MRGTLKGHSGWVTSLATSLEKLVGEKLFFELRTPLKS